MGPGNSREPGGRQEGGALTRSSSTGGATGGASSTLAVHASLASAASAQPSRDGTQSGTGRPSRGARELGRACPGRQGHAPCEPFPALNKISWSSAISSRLFSLVHSKSSAPTEGQLQAHGSLSALFSCPRHGAKHAEGRSERVLEGTLRPLGVTSS